MVVVYLSSFLFAAYITLVISLFGVPASISDSYYLLSGRWKNAGILFTVWCFILGVLVASRVFDLSEGLDYQFLGLFTGGGLGFVGAAPLFKTYEKRVHFVSAAVCALSALTWMCLAGWWFVPVSLLVVCGVIAARDNKWTFWMEIGLFTSMLTVLWCLS
jgi:hypothetical protein